MSNSSGVGASPAVVEALAVDNIHALAIFAGLPSVHEPFAAVSDVPSTAGAHMHAL